MFNTSGKVANCNQNDRHEDLPISHSTAISKDQRLTIPSLPVGLRRTYYFFFFSSSTRLTGPSLRPLLRLCIAHLNDPCLPTIFKCPQTIKLYGIVNFCLSTIWPKLWLNCFSMRPVVVFGGPGAARCMK